MTAQPAKHRPVGIIGLGLMGSAITEKTVASRFHILGHDSDPVRLHDFKGLGGQPATPAEIAGRCSIIVLAVTRMSQARKILHSLRSILKPNAIILNIVTGSPEQAIQLADLLKPIPAHYLDATIAGNSAELLRREVLALIGGEHAILRRCRPLLDVFCRRIFHLGPVGAGSRMKLVFNLALGLHRAVLAETLMFARAIGISPKTALEILREGTAYSRVMDNKGGKMLARDFIPQARLDQHLKDVSAILQLARSHSARVPLSRLHSRLLRQLVKTGNGSLDNSAILKAFEI